MFSVFSFQFLVFYKINCIQTDPYKRNVNHGSAIFYFQQLWVYLIGFTFTLIIQSLAANLGVSTGKMHSKPILDQNIAN